jgi:hypothetical protein
MWSFKAINIRSLQDRARLFEVVSSLASNRAIFAPMLSWRTQLTKTDKA